MFKTMNSSYLREIPLRILNRKIGDERVTLLQACYDNPIFNEDDAKGIPQQNGTDKSGKPATDANGVEEGTRGHQASEYMHSLPPTTSPTPAGVVFLGHRKRRRRCILYAAFTLLVLVIGIAVLVYLMEGDQGASSSDSTPSPEIFVARVEVNMTLKGGLFSQYQLDFLSTETGASKLLRGALMYQLTEIFSASEYPSLHSINTTKIVRIWNTNGSVSLTFILKPSHPVSFSDDAEGQIAILLLKGLKGRYFGIDSQSLSVKVYEVSVNPFLITPGACVPIQFKPCVNLTDYSNWTTPNVVGDWTPEEVTTYLQNRPTLFSLQCHTHYQRFLCSAFFPSCGDKELSPTKPVLPCKGYCDEIMSVCQDDLDKHNLTLPFKCNDLLDSEDPGVCIQPHPEPGKCVPVTNTVCQAEGFNSTSYPNILGHLAVNGQGAFTVNFVNKIYHATRCDKHTNFFMCSIISPRCSGRPVPNHVIPPCRSLCQQFRDNCDIFLDVFNITWPTRLKCENLPESVDESVCVGYKEAHEKPGFKECYNSDVECQSRDMCIRKRWLCDGVQDCTDNSDETHCAVCAPDEERCSTQSALCIAKTQACDGITDCYSDTEELYCVRQNPDPDLDTLEVRNPVTSAWEHVCRDGWTKELSDITCRQLGYSETLDTYYTAQNLSTSAKSLVSTFRNGSDPEKLQSYLLKGEKTCQSGYIVNLQCWKAVCGMRPAYVPSPLRVVGGEEAAPGTWPWMVSLHGGAGLSFFCGASIIDEEWVLTAAHCVGHADKITNYWTLITGNTRRTVFSEHRQMRKPKRLFRHKDFDPKTVENDIALIQLEKPFKMNDYVRALCLPEKRTLAGTRCMVTGWGKTRTDATDYEKFLLQAPVDVTSWTYCQSALAAEDTRYPYRLKSSMFCAGGATAYDSCQGDSGGPLVCRQENKTDAWYQSGVVSWGISCALTNVPAVYTNLVLYLDWIHAVIANNSQPVGGGT